MPADPDAPVLFRVVSAPTLSLGWQGVRVVGLVILTGSVVVATFCLMLGAWPVLGFTGLESILVFGLLLLHRRQARRRREEVLLLRDGRMLVRRTDASGRRQERCFDAYWASLRLEEHPDGTSTLRLRSRHRSAVLGAMLGDDGRRALAADLGAALRAWREPVFDNPQLGAAPGEWPGQA